MSSSPQGHGAVADARGLRLVKLALGAVGVVYGDIGTSPLYAIRECFHREYDEHGQLVHGVMPDETNVLGIVSLVFWSLLVVVVVKYLTFVMRADNEGEGGIVSLTSLIVPRKGKSIGLGFLVLLGLFGAALLYGDAMITPAISVLSAVEGLGVANPLLTDLAVPISIVILVGLFSVQRWGTGKLGFAFGFIMVGWFAALAVTGAPWIVRAPLVLWAISPHHAVMFFVNHGFSAFQLLGSVVLVVTGGEALYADMGHFGRKGIRVAWYLIVYPALLLNYFGQGALILTNPAAAESPFFSLVPREWLYPMVALSTFAVVVASQALISGAFSMTRQAVQLGYFPRVSIMHTSGREEGQIYIPEINEFMMVGCIALVLGFRSSSGLAAAYGLAVTGTMSITSVLFYAVMRDRLGKNRALQLTALFLVFDLAFFASNTLKLQHGGWVPLAIAGVIFIAMTTWQRGRAFLGAYVTSLARPLEEFLASLREAPPVRVPGTAVVLSTNPNLAPPVLLHHLRHNQVLHEKLLLMHILTERVPEVPGSDRIVFEDKGEGVWHVTVRYGFMQTPNVPLAIDACIAKGIPIDRDRLTYYLGRETLLPTGQARMMRWRKRLFMFLSRNSRPPTYYFRIPPDRVVEIGMQIPL